MLRGLIKANPALILTSIAPFDYTGLYKDFKGYDLVGVAKGGLMYVGGFPEDAPRQAEGGE